MSDFPETFDAFRTWPRDAGAGYSTPLGTMTEEDIAYYADGHPYVASMRIATYRLESIRDVPVDGGPEATSRWYERTGR